jgi:hypothetical protein
MLAGPGPRNSAVTRLNRYAGNVLGDRAIEQIDGFVLKKRAPGPSREEHRWSSGWRSRAARDRRYGEHISLSGDFLWDAPRQSQGSAGRSILIGSELRDEPRRSRLALFR